MTEAKRVQEFRVVELRDDHIAIWPWLHAPEFLRDQLKHTWRFLLYIPATIPLDAVEALTFSFDNGEDDLHIERFETGDGGMIVGFA